MSATMRRPGPVAALALAVVLGVGAALAHVYVHLQVIQLGYELSRETKLRHDIGEQNQKLRLELAVRKDPGQIERRARQELHMDAPDPRLIRVVQRRDEKEPQPSDAVSAQSASAGTRKVDPRPPSVAGRAPVRSREVRR